MKTFAIALALGTQFFSVRRFGSIWLSGFAGNFVLKTEDLRRT
jgi:hypothetical protein